MIRRLVREVALYGLCGGVLIAALRLAQYRFVVVEHSVEIYGGIVAAVFAGLGIWLGGTLTRKGPEATAPGPFVRDEDRIRELQITPRELQVLGLIAEGLAEGRVVEKGDVLGFVGTSGNAPPDTPHLHFAITKTSAPFRRHGGTPINPYAVLR